MMKKIIAMILIIAYMMMPVYKVERPSIIGKCGNKTSVNVDGRQYDVIVNEVPMEKTIQKTNYKNLKICPSTIDLAGAEALFSTEKY